MSETAPIRLGVLGLGRAFTLMVPTFARDPRVRIVAGHDPRPEAMQRLHADFGARTHANAQSLCDDPEVEWLYVATPHPMHAEHVCLAAAHGKSVLLEKPMALRLDDCTRMIETCRANGVSLIVGHSHSFDAPVLLARQIIDSGAIGAVRMLQAFNYTDFLYRPRRPEELDTAQGGGVVFSQAAHQMDIVRLLAGGRVRSVYARTGQWDSKRPTEGAYSALLDFENGAFATVSYNGYGYYDSDALMEGMGELGQRKSSDAHQQTRERWRTADEAVESERKARRNYGGPDYVPALDLAPEASQHFGPVWVSGERGDLRLTPRGVEIHDDQGVRFVTAPLSRVPRVEVIDELVRVAREGVAPLHSGAWSRATMEVCLAVLASAREGRAIILHHQVEPAGVLPSP
jgi:phthalate 4,5-cis-dihydrodiol dehydrogenase